MAALSVVVGTLGRASLDATLESIRSQRLDGDETVVVSANPMVAVKASEYGCRFVRIPNPGNDWGDTERQVGMDAATADYVCFLDDDDIHLPGARQEIEDAIAANPSKPLMFRMRFGEDGGVLFLEPEVKLGNCGTPMFVLPNDKAKLGTWGKRKANERGGDYDFLCSMQWPHAEIVWVRKVIVQVTPERIRVEPEPVSIPAHRPLRVLLVHPGASWSTADVEAGLRYGLEQHGVEVLRYRLDVRIERSGRWLHSNWRIAKKENAALEKPTKADILYQASIGVLERALRLGVDAVIVVSAMCLHPDAIILMKRAGIRVVVLFTETPYDIEHELKIAGIVDGCWTGERTAVQQFRAVNPNVGFLPHAWHPERHRPDLPVDDVIPSHDVVFVGSGFTERVHWFNAIDWTGIDLGLYGTWKKLGLNKQVLACVRADQVPNELASALYRKAKIGLNLYRKSRGFGRYAPHIKTADSLSPRAYELAACGVFHLSDYRAEVSEVFGDLVPTFQHPNEAARLIRHWLADDAGRERIAAALPARVAESSWVQRAACVIGDVQALLALPARTAA